MDLSEVIGLANYADKDKERRQTGQALGLLQQDPNASMPEGMDPRFWQSAQASRATLEHQTLQNKAEKLATDQKEVISNLAALMDNPDAFASYAADAFTSKFPNKMASKYLGVDQDGKYTFQLFNKGKDDQGQEQLSPVGDPVKYDSADQMRKQILGYAFHPDIWSKEMVTGHFNQTERGLARTVGDTTTIVPGTGKHVGYTQQGAPLYPEDVQGYQGTIFHQQPGQLDDVNREHILASTRHMGLTDQYTSWRMSQEKRDQDLIAKGWVRGPDGQLHSPAEMDQLRFPEVLKERNAIVESAGKELKNVLIPDSMSATDEKRSIYNMLLGYVSNISPSVVGKMTGPELASMAVSSAQEAGLLPDATGIIKPRMKDVPGLVYGRNQAPLDPQEKVQAFEDIFGSRTNQALTARGGMAGKNSPGRGTMSAGAQAPDAMASPPLPGQQPQPGQGQQVRPQIYDPETKTGIKVETGMARQGKAGTQRLMWYESGRGTEMKTESVTDPVSGLPAVKATLPDGRWFIVR